jgi:hypothetical protein
MNKTDLAALSLAIETQRKRGPAHRTQIDNMLRREPWESVGRFAAYSCQCDSLNLAPWETPPIWIDDIGAALNAPQRRQAHPVCGAVAAADAGFGHLAISSEPVGGD